MNKPMTLDELAAVLRTLPTEKRLTEALEVQAARLALDVQARLGTHSGGLHDEPWLKTGALQESIEFSVEGLNAQVGSNNVAAAPQEFGTMHAPPRPFFLPAADALAGSIASDIGASLLRCLLGGID